MCNASEQIVIFKSADGKIFVDTHFDTDTAWLSLDQMAELFDRDKSTISRHIKKIFDEGELQRDSVVANFATTAADQKNYLSVQELHVLNNLVSAYFDLAELNAIEKHEMKMKDYVRELDTILSSAGRELLYNAEKISHEQAKNKAELEFKQYKAKTLEQVEEEYLRTINALEIKAKKESRKK